MAPPYLTTHQAMKLSKQLKKPSQEIDDCEHLSLIGDRPDAWADLDDEELKRVIGVKSIEYGATQDDSRTMREKVSSRRSWGSFPDTESNTYFGWATTTGATDSILAKRWTTRPDRCLPACLRRMLAR